MLQSKMSVDQAAGLRRMARSRPVRVIAVTGGKGGVGKSTVAINLALAFAQAGRDVMLLDADLGLANVDVMLGLSARLNLSHVIDGQCSLGEVIVTGPLGVRIVPAASGTQRMADLSPREHAGLISAFSGLPRTPDVLIVDTAAGISHEVMSFSSAAQEVMVVVTDEPSSLTDAYALIKVLSRDFGQRRFRVVANQVQGPPQGREVFERLTRVTDRFLDVVLDLAGSIPADEHLRRAVHRQRAVVEAYPRSRAAQAFKHLAVKADNWPVPAASGGRLEFFVERLITASQALKE
jgi:flagellar biosynthesis protein FlhG